MKTWTVFQNCDKRIIINLNCIEIFDNIGMVEPLMGLIFPDGMFNVVHFDTGRPVGRQRVHLWTVNLLCRPRVGSVQYRRLCRPQSSLLCPAKTAVGTCSPAKASFSVQNFLFAVLSKKDNWIFINSTALLLKSTLVISKSVIYHFAIYSFTT